MWQIKKSKILLFLLYITSQASTHQLRFSPATGTAMFSKRSTIAFMKHYLYITLLKVTFIESRSRLVKKKVCLAIFVYLIGIGILQILNRRSTVNVKTSSSPVKEWKWLHLKVICWLKQVIIHIRPSLIRI